MKEATGELNMTVITVVAIAAVGALFTFFVWPNIQQNLLLSTACSQLNANGNYTSQTGNTAKGAKGTLNGTVKCTNFKCTATYNGKTYTRECNTGNA